MFLEPISEYYWDLAVCRAQTQDRLKIKHKEAGAALTDGQKSTRQGLAFRAPECSGRSSRMNH